MKKIFITLALSAAIMVTGFCQKKNIRAKNVILLIGDGMGAAQIYGGLTANKGSLNLERCTHAGFHRNQSSDDYVTDSGAGATAFACGYKSYNGAIGVDEKKIPRTTILEIAESNGKSTGLIATCSITHATPASFIAHQPSRQMVEEIAADFLKTDIDVFVGGGRKHFITRSDGKNLVNDLKSKNYQIANTIEEVEKIASVDEVKWTGGESHITMVGKEMDEAYISMVKNLSIYPEVIERQHNLCIVYTPIHGTGIKLVPEVLQRFGFSNVHVVDEQATPDGNFPTVAYPNPEEKETMSLGLKKAREIDADILLGTDPDADRVGIGIKNDRGEWVLMNGNQTAVLAFNYMIEARKVKGIAQPNDMVVKTIVTTDMIDEIARQSRIKCYNVLTGFKWIAELIKEKEKTENYVIGGEESYGLMIGDKLRDKDAVSAVALLCEMAAYEKNKGRTLYDKLIDLYLQFGFYKESLISITKKGMDGQKQIADMMASYRNHPLQSINGSPVIQLLDYETSTGKNLKTGEQWKIVLPVSNVLQFVLEDGSKISARPSGTEPKIKFYFSVHEKLVSRSSFETTDAVLQKRIDAIIADMNLN